MINKKSESYIEVMRPLTFEEYDNCSLLNLLNDDEDEDKSISDLLSDDSWKKFELDFPELSTVDDIFKDLGTSNNLNTWSLDQDDKNCVFITQHDCMWTGHCCDKEHSEEFKYPLGNVIPKPPVIKKPVPRPATSGQQSLLKPSVKAASVSLVASNNIIQHTPQTPPESDDEETKGNSNLLKILNEAINDYDLDNDTELREYVEGKEVEVKEEPLDIKEEPLECQTEQDDTESEQDEMSYQKFQQYRLRTQLAAENDHSYHKDKNAAMRHNNYGIDTPSESEDEEEIDVVSVSDKFGSNANRMALSLPTNPSNTDRQHLQRKMATAMSRKSINNGIKTILPVRSIGRPSSSPSSCASSSKTTRGVKRGRGTRTNAGYKRRRTNQDGDKEPSDKRHLHNDMERQRRVDLRIAFENLKAVVPEVSGTKKIAKVNILLQSAQYCYYLTNTNTNYTKHIEELKKRQIWLRSRLSQLRKSLAARR